MYTNVWLPEVLNSLITAGKMSRTNATAPAVNVRVSDADYVVELAAPGMRKEDFDVNINADGDLMIRMARKRPEGEEQVRYLRREFAYSNYEQTLILPDDVDRNKIGAAVADGVLTVRLPKVGQDGQKVARSIQIA